MGKVELSIKEYDDLKDSLRIYKEIVEALTAASISEWELESLKSGSYSYIRSNPHFSTEARDILLGHMKTSLVKLLNENNMNPSDYDCMINLGANFDIGTISKKERQ